MKLRDLTFQFNLDIGVLRIHTALWHDEICYDEREYVVIFLEVWRHEVFRFRLYETGMSMLARGKR